MYLTDYQLGFVTGTAVYVVAAGIGYSLFRVVIMALGLKDRTA